MNIEELAFKNYYELKDIQKVDLLLIIDFLQKDRKQWINQYTQAHNDYVNLQQENTELKEKLSVVNQMDTDNYNKYCEALKENTDLKKQLEYLRSGEYLNQLKFERNMLENIVQNMEVSKEDKEFINMTHRNTELLEENQELKDRINKATEKLKKGLLELDKRRREEVYIEQYIEEVIDLLKEDNKEKVDE